MGITQIVHLLFPYSAGVGHRVVFAQGLQDGEGKRQGYGKRAHVRHRLAHLHPLQAEQPGQQQDKRDEEQPLPCRSQHHRPHGLADGLQHHVTNDGKCPQWVSNELPT